MEWLFIGLTLGCAVFLFKIISEYMNESPVWSSKVEKAEKERFQYEAQLETLVKTKENSAEVAKSIDQEIKNLEQMRDELRHQIEATKKEMARQGKIIMKRQSL